MKNEKSLWLFSSIFLSGKTVSFIPVRCDDVLLFVHLYTQVQRSGSSVGIATGYGLDDSGIESRWRRYFPHKTVLGAHPAFCTMGTGSFPGVKGGRVVTLTPYPLLVPWSWKGIAIPLLLLWAVRPVQSLSACTKVTFTFTFTHKCSTPFLSRSLPVFGIDIILKRLFLCATFSYTEFLFWASWKELRSI